MSDVECDLEELTAFLEASDSDSDDEEPEQQEAAANNSGQTAHCSDAEFEDYDDGAMEELDSMIENHDSATGVQTVSSEIQTHGTRSEPQSGTDGQLRLTGAKNHSEEQSNQENQPTSQSTETSSASAGTKLPVFPDSIPEEIRAEMIAMQKRMKELQALLEKSQSADSQKCEVSQSQSPNNSHMTSQKNNHVSPWGPPSSSSNHVSPRHLNNSQSQSTNTTLSSNKCSRSQEKKRSGDGSEGRQSYLSCTACDKTNACDKTDVSASSRRDSTAGSGLSTVGRTSDFRTANTCKSGGKVESKRSHKETSNNVREESNPFFDEGKSKSNLLENSEAVTSRSVFGDSDDSDWDELDGEEKKTLSSEGREIKKLLKSGPRHRVAHTPKYDLSTVKKAPATGMVGLPGSSQQSPSAPGGDTVTSSRLGDSAASQTKSKYALKEEYKLKSTLPSSAATPVDSVADPYCGIQIITPRISMNEFKRKMEGRTMLKVSRLASKTNSQDLLKGNWVTVGVVVHKTEPRQSSSGKTFCIWKLTDLQDCDKTITFFLFGNVYKEHWKNDLGTVVGLLNPSLMDKAEKAQAEMAFTINHPQQLLVMGVSRDLGRCRGTTKAGNHCSAFINKQQGEFCTYHVQSAYRKLSSKRTELQASTGAEPKAFQKLKKKIQGGCFIYGGTSYTTLVPPAKSSQDDVTLKKLQHQEARKTTGKVTTMSLHELEPEDEAILNKLKADKKDGGLLELISVPTVGSMNLVKHLVKKDTQPTAELDEKGKPAIQSISAKELLKQHQALLTKKKTEAARPDPLQAKPTLGRGFQPGMEICFDSPRSTSSSAQAKKQALAKIQASGGVQKIDPNAVRKKVTSPECKEKIKKRVAEDTATEDSCKDPETSEPPKKRSKLLGNIDLNSPEVQKLLKTKSKHTGALAQAEAEHEERYFMELEKKERVEDKMASVKEMAVTAVQCLQCKYKAYKLADRCKQENHPSRRVKATKRFYKCKTCKRRMTTLDRIPTKACTNCGNTNFERTSMLNERSGPKLESEQLSLRGNEQKFVGSLNQQSFLNI